MDPQNKDTSPNDATGNDDKNNKFTKNEEYSNKGTNTSNEEIGEALDKLITNTSIKDDFKIANNKKKRKQRLIIFLLVLIPIIILFRTQLDRIQQEGINKRRQEASITLKTEYNKLLSANWPYELAYSKEPYDAGCEEFNYKFETNEFCYYKAKIAMIVPRDNNGNANDSESTNTTFREAKLAIQNLLYDIYEIDNTQDALVTSGLGAILSKSSEATFELGYFYDEVPKYAVNDEEFILFNNELIKGNSVILVNLQIIYDSDNLRAFIH